MARLKSVKVGGKYRVRRGGKTFLRAAPGEGRKELSKKVDKHRAVKIAALGLLGAVAVKKAGGHLIDEVNLHQADKIGEQLFSHIDDKKERAKALLDYYEVGKEQINNDPNIDEPTRNYYLNQTRKVDRLMTKYRKRNSI